MSHLIDMSNNRANMAYIGDTPWHGLGQLLDSDAGIDQWKVAAGLDWHIQKRPLSFGIKNDDGSRSLAVYPDRFAHVRSDTQTAIGMGSNKFQLVQPGDTLEFFRDLVSDSRFTIETAGSLKGGAKIWALARCNLDLTLGGNDTMKPYLLLASANDGSMATVADFTTVRVVCRNTLSMAVGDNGGKAAIKIPHSTRFDGDSVRAELGLIDERLETFARDADTLTQIALSDAQAVEFFCTLYAKRDERGNVTNEKSLKSVTAKLMQLYRRGPGADLDSARGTAWGAVNAVTNHVDFSTRARSDENRFNSGQFGIGANLKTLAFDNALKIAA
jgi:phage/plasmid-like protein (TIGR03299 family)